MLSTNKISKEKIDNIVHITKDGTKIKLKDMTDEHLEKAFRLAIRKGQGTWAGLFLSEKLIRRGEYGDDEFNRISDNDYDLYI